MSEPMSSPIADLSYRNYDGPLESPNHRWWPIARATMQMGIKKKGFWLVASLSAWYYVVMLIVFYVVGVLQQNAGQRGQNLTETFFSRIVWKDQFLHAFSYGQMIYLVLALMLGAGAIANDNRANALLVYLSKPVRKVDYLIGKWLGVVIVMTLVSLIPMLFFYFYCAMSYREFGFFSQDPWLILKIILMAPVSGLIYGSLVIGVSSLFKQGRLAGATLTGAYFFSYFFTNLVTVMRLNQLGSKPEVINLAIDPLWYLSIDGLNIGLAKIILGTRGAPPFNSDAPFVLPGIPPALIFVPAIILLCGVALLTAWSRIRAVEVVG